MTAQLARACLIAGLAAGILGMAALTALHFSFLFTAGLPGTLALIVTCSRCKAAWRGDRPRSVTVANGAIVAMAVALAVIETPLAIVYGVPSALILVGTRVMPGRKGALPELPEADQAW